MKRSNRPSVWMMIKEAVAELGGTTSRGKIARWVRRYYPGTNAITIGAQTTICTVNNPVRVKYTQNSRARTERSPYDFLYAKPDGSLVWYVPAKHGKWIIARDSRGKLAVRRLSREASGKCDEPQLHVFYCGAPSFNKDYAFLSNLAEHGGYEDWSSLKGARAGDRVLFYTVQERQAFVASGWITRNAQPTKNPKDYRYRALVGAVRLLPDPVPLATVRHRFPSWRWTLYTRNIVTVPDKIAKALWQLIHREGKAPPMAAPGLATESKPGRKIGAGFGDAKNNKLVEKAAIAAAKRHLKRKGYTVKSFERLNIGYDLQAKRRRDELHVEVKGISGDNLAFVITENETATARIDPFFRLMTVTRARTRKPRIEEFTGPEVLKKFSLRPLSYSAVLI